jgi:hypothetical protein
VASQTAGLQVFDFVDEALDILNIFTEKRVTQLAWQGFDALYTAFNLPNSEASAAVHFLEKV